MSLTNCRCCLRSPALQFAVQRATARLDAITLGRLRHSNISAIRAQTQAVYGRITDDRWPQPRTTFSPELGHKASRGSLA
jgi:hypothetical protein